MKRLILIFSLILLLTACGKAEKEPLPLPPKTDINGTQLLPPEGEPLDPPTVEVETTIVAPDETQLANSDEIVFYTSETVEGLIEDTVGYIFEIPAFDVEGSENIRTYYEELTKHLESYTKDSVYTEAASRACIVSVYGEVIDAVLDGDVLTVTYVYRCDYSDTEESSENVRTDSFFAATGEAIDN